MGGAGEGGHPVEGESMRARASSRSRRVLGRRPAVVQGEVEMCTYLCSAQSRTRVSHTDKPVDSLHSISSRLKLAHAVASTANRVSTESGGWGLVRQAPAGAENHPHLPLLQAAPHAVVRVRPRDRGRLLGPPEFATRLVRRGRTLTLASLGGGSGDGAVHGVSPRRQKPCLHTPPANSACGCT